MSVSLPTRAFQRSVRRNPRVSFPDPQRRLFSASFASDSCNSSNSFNSKSAAELPGVSLVQSAESGSLKAALRRFREAVRNSAKRTGAFAWSAYEGWPPRSRIRVGDERSEFGPLRRQVFLFNRRLKTRARGGGGGGKEEEEEGGGSVAQRSREPSLAICSRGGRCLLMLSEAEFEALMQLLPWIKKEFAEFRKQL